jgi:hypothetical protein
MQAAVAEAVESSGKAVGLQVGRGLKRNQSAEAVIAAVVGDHNHQSQRQ